MIVIFTPFFIFGLLILVANYTCLIVALTNIVWRNFIDQEIARMLSERQNTIISQVP